MSTEHLCSQVGLYSSTAVIKSGGLVIDQKLNAENSATCGSVLALGGTHRHHVLVARRPARAYYREAASRLDRFQNSTGAEILVPLLNDLIDVLRMGFCLTCSWQDPRPRR